MNKYNDNKVLKTFINIYRGLLVVLTGSVGALFYLAQ